MEEPEKPVTKENLVHDLSKDEKFLLQINLEDKVIILQNCNQNIGKKGPHSNFKKLQTITDRKISKSML